MTIVCEYEYLNKKGLPCKALFAFFVFFFATTALTGQSHAREIIDMFGRRFDAPACPKRVYGTSPPVTYVLYAIDPAMIAGLNSPLRASERRYLSNHMQELPVLGGWFGQGNTPNLEMILKVNPEVIITSKHNSVTDNRIDKTMKTMPMPVINVTLDTLSDYPDTLHYLGQVLGRRARAEGLVSYARRTLSEMAVLAASIPAQKRVLVYYAEGVDGLNTECDLSQHSELIGLVGGKNVHRCQAKTLYGMEKITFEQLMLYNPDVIVAQEKAFYDKIIKEKDPAWQNIKAVKEKRVYLIPRAPFNWFDRPPSFMRILGLKWLMNILYPKEYQIDIIKEAREFYRLFLGVEVSNEEMRQIVYP